VGDVVHQVQLNWESQNQSNQPDFYINSQSIVIQQQEEEAVTTQSI
jgi:hypothetical protein